MKSGGGGAGGWRGGGGHSYKYNGGSGKKSGERVQGSLLLHITLITNMHYGGLLRLLLSRIAN